MRVRHTKCTITHTHAGIYIYKHASCTMLSHRIGKVIQTLPMFQGYGLARYGKSKIDIVIPRECGLSKEQENKRVHRGEPKYML